MEQVSKLIAETRGLDERAFLERRQNWTLFLQAASDTRFISVSTGLVPKIEDNEAVAAVTRLMQHAREEPSLLQRYVDLPLASPKGPRVATVGRLADNTIMMHEHSVSKEHATFAVQPDNKVTLLDQHSTNGSFVNGVKVEPMHPTTLADGDVVVLGRQPFLLAGPEMTWILLSKLR